MWSGERPHERMKMPIPTEAKLLRVFVSDSDRLVGKPLYRAVVEKARDMDLAGATVLPAPIGFGHSRIIRTEMNVDADIGLPIVIEIIDTEEQINRFLPVLDGMMHSGLITLERVRALQFRAKKGEPNPPPE